MRTPSLLADFIHSRDCKLICAKLLTLPNGCLHKKITPIKIELPESFWLQGFRQYLLSYGDTPKDNSFFEKKKRIEKIQFLVRVFVIFCT